MLIKLACFGKTINLTSDWLDIRSNNFSVDEEGNMSCNTANVSGKINVGGDESNPEFICKDSDNEKVEIWPGNVYVDSPLYEGSCGLAKRSCVGPRLW